MAEDKEITKVDESDVPSVEQIKEDAVPKKPAAKKVTKKAETLEEAAEVKEAPVKKTTKKVSSDVEDVPKKKATSKKAVEVTEDTDKKVAIKKEKEVAAETVKPEVKKATAKKASKNEDVIVIRLTRSLSGRINKQISTATSMGLRKVGDTVKQPNNEATLGKIARISHMVEIVNR